MIPRWVKSRLPKPEHLEQYQLFRWFSPGLQHPGYWALNRRSVSGAVAAGLFCGLIPGPFQVLGALAWVLVWRVNIAVAILVTFYTNPLTIVPLYVFATAYGHLLLGGANGAAIAPAPAWDWSANSESVVAYWDWMLSLGSALAVGLPATMVTFSVVGWLTVRLLWTLVIRWEVFRRRRARAKRDGARFS